MRGLALREWQYVTAFVALGTTATLINDLSTYATSLLQNSSTQRSLERMQMVESQLLSRGINDPRVIAAMQVVPRERFIPLQLQQSAYLDRPLPIGYQQTISQPFVVAYMTESLRLKPTSRVLEIGTGSGYQAAILGEIARTVYSIEIIQPLYEQARTVLAEEGYDNVHVQLGDGYTGWPEKAPFDAIIVTAAPDHIPQPLVEQLAVGGRLIVPLGDNRQVLTEIVRTENDIIQESTLPVIFVPMTGQAEQR